MHVKSGALSTKTVGRRAARADVPLSHHYPPRGAVSGIIRQLVGGLCSGVSYCGAHDIEGMQANAEFIRITPAGRKESGSHDISEI